MQPPVFLPPSLTSLYCSADTDALFLELISNRPKEELLLFLDYALEDETWCEEHRSFLKDALQLVSSLFFKDRLPAKAAHKLATALCRHMSVIHPLIPQDLTFQIEGRHVSANRFLFGVSCDFFHALVYPSEKEEEEDPAILITDIPYTLFLLIHEFVMNGHIDTLWKHEQEELYLLLKQASRLRLEGLSTLCQELLKRYVSRDNAIAILQTAHQEKWLLLKSACCHLIDAMSLGVKLSDEEAAGEVDPLLTSSPFFFEFLQFSHTALELFSSLKHLITHLICKGSLTEDPVFIEVVQKAPKVVSVDISNSPTLSPYLSAIPAHIAELNASQCLWLTDSTFRYLITLCPHLKRLSLDGNSQLGYSALGELKKLPYLHALDLSHIEQLKDEDFTVILKACRELSELKLVACRQLTRNTFFELGRQLPNLIKLDLSRCSITDIALLEITLRCRQLCILKLNRCEELSEKGILQAVSEAHSLQKLELGGRKLSPYATEQLLPWM